MANAGSSTTGAAASRGSVPDDVTASRLSDPGRPAECYLDAVWDRLLQASRDDRDRWQAAAAGARYPGDLDWSVAGLRDYLAWHLEQHADRYQPVLTGLAEHGVSVQAVAMQLRQPTADPDRAGSEWPVLVGLTWVLPLAVSALFRVRTISLDPAGHFHDTYAATISADAVRSGMSAGPGQATELAADTRARIAAAHDAGAIVALVTGFPPGYLLPLRPVGPGERPPIYYAPPESNLFAPPHPDWRAVPEWGGRPAMPATDDPGQVPFDHLVGRDQAATEPDDVFELAPDEVLSESDETHSLADSLSQMLISQPATPQRRRPLRSTADYGDRTERTKSNDLDSPSSDDEFQDTESEGDTASAGLWEGMALEQLPAELAQTFDDLGKIVRISGSHAWWIWQWLAQEVDPVTSREIQSSLELSEHHVNLYLAAMTTVGLIKSSSGLLHWAVLPDAVRKKMSKGGDLTTLQGVARWIKSMNPDMAGRVRKRLGAVTLSDSGRWTGVPVSQLPAALIQPFEELRGVPHCNIPAAWRIWQWMVQSDDPVTSPEIQTRLELGHSQVAKHLAALVAVGLINPVGRQSRSQLFEAVLPDAVRNKMSKSGDLASLPGFAGWIQELPPKMADRVRKRLGKTTASVLPIPPALRGKFDKLAKLPYLAQDTGWLVWRWLAQQDGPVSIAYLQDALGMRGDTGRRYVSGMANPEIRLAVSSRGKGKALLYQAVLPRGWSKSVLKPAAVDTTVTDSDSEMDTSTGTDNTEDSDSGGDDPGPDHSRDSASFSSEEDLSSAELSSESRSRRSSVADMVVDALTPPPGDDQTVPTELDSQPRPTPPAGLETIEPAKPVVREDGLTDAQHATAAGLGLTFQDMNRTGDCYYETLWRLAQNQVCETLARLRQPLTIAGMRAAVADELIRLRQDPHLATAFASGMYTSDVLDGAVEDILQTGHFADDGGDLAPQIAPALFGIAVYNINLEGRIVRAAQLQDPRAGETPPDPPAARCYLVRISQPGMSDHYIAALPGHGQSTTVRPPLPIPDLLAPSRGAATTSLDTTARSVIKSARQGKSRRATLAAPYTVPSRELRSRAAVHAPPDPAQSGVDRSRASESGARPVDQAKVPKSVTESRTVQLDQSRRRTTVTTTYADGRVVESTSTETRLRPDPTMDDEIPWHDPDDPTHVYQPFAGQDGRLHHVIRDRVRNDPNAVTARMLDSKAFFEGIAEDSDDPRLPDKEPNELKKWWPRLESAVAKEVRRRILGKPKKQPVVPDILTERDVQPHEQILVGQYGLFVNTGTDQQGRRQRVDTIPEKEWATVEKGAILGLFSGVVLTTEDEADWQERFSGLYPDYSMAIRGQSWWMDASTAASSITFVNTALKPGTDSPEYDDSAMNAAFVTFLITLPDKNSNPYEIEVVAMVALRNAYADNPLGTIVVDYGPKYLKRFAAKKPVTPEKPAKMGSDPADAAGRLSEPTVVDSAPEAHSAGQVLIAAMRELAAAELEMATAHQDWVQVRNQEQSADQDLADVQGQPSARHAGPGQPSARATRSSATTQATAVDSVRQFLTGRTRSDLAGPPRWRPPENLGRQIRQAKALLTPLDSAPRRASARLRDAAAEHQLNGAIGRLAAAHVARVDARHRVDIYRRTGRLPVPPAAFQARVDLLSSVLERAVTLPVQLDFQEVSHFVTNYVAAVEKSAPNTSASRRSGTPGEADHGDPHLSVRDAQIQAFTLLETVPYLWVQLEPGAQEAVTENLERLLAPAPPSNGMLIDEFVSTHQRYHDNDTVPTASPDAGASATGDHGVTDLVSSVADVVTAISTENMVDHVMMVLGGATGTIPAVGSGNGMLVTGAGSSRPEPVRSGRPSGTEIEARWRDRAYRYGQALAAAVSGARGSTLSAAQVAELVLAWRNYQHTTRLHDQAWEDLETLLESSANDNSPRVVQARDSVRAAAAAVEHARASLVEMGADPTMLAAVDWEFVQRYPDPGAGGARPRATRPRGQQAVDPTPSPGSEVQPMMKRLKDYKQRLERSGPLDSHSTTTSTLGTDVSASGSGAAGRATQPATELASPQALPAAEEDERALAKRVFARWSATPPPAEPGRASTPPRTPTPPSVPKETGSGATARNQGRSVRPARLTTQDFPHIQFGSRTAELINNPTSRQPRSWSETWNHVLDDELRLIAQRRSQDGGSAVGGPNGVNRTTLGRAWRDWRDALARAAVGAQGDPDAARVVRRTPEEARAALCALGADPDRLAVAYDQLRPRFPRGSSPGGGAPGQRSDPTPRPVEPLSEVISRVVVAWRPGGTLSLRETVKQVLTAHGLPMSHSADNPSATGGTEPHPVLSRAVEFHMVRLLAEALAVGVTNAHVRAVRVAHALGTSPAAVDAVIQRLGWRPKQAAQLWSQVSRWSSTPQGGREVSFLTSAIPPSQHLPRPAPAAPGQTAAPPLPTMVGLAAASAPNTPISALQPNSMADDRPLTGHQLGILRWLSDQTGWRYDWWDPEPNGDCFYTAMWLMIGDYLQQHPRVQAVTALGQRPTVRQVRLALGKYVADNAPGDLYASLEGLGFALGESTIQEALGLGERVVANLPAGGTDPATHVHHQVMVAVNKWRDARSIARAGVRTEGLASTEEAVAVAVQDAAGLCTAIGVPASPGVCAALSYLLEAAHRAAGPAGVAAAQQAVLATYRAAAMAQQSWSVADLIRAGVSATMRPAQARLQESIATSGEWSSRRAEYGVELFSQAFEVRLNIIDTDATYSHDDGGLFPAGSPTVYVLRVRPPDSHPLVGAGVLSTDSSHYRAVVPRNPVTGQSDLYAPSLIPPQPPAPIRPAPLVDTQSTASGTAEPASAVNRTAPAVPTPSIPLVPGQRVEVEVDADGQVTYRGVRFQLPAGWAQQRVQAVDDRDDAGQALRSGDVVIFTRVSSLAAGQTPQHVAIPITTDHARGGVLGATGPNPDRGDYLRRLPSYAMIKIKDSRLRVNSLQVSVTWYVLAPPAGTLVRLARDSDSANRQTGPRWWVFPLDNTEPEAALGFVDLPPLADSTNPTGLISGTADSETNHLVGGVLTRLPKLPRGFVGQWHWQVKQDRHGPLGQYGGYTLLAQIGAHQARPIDLDVPAEDKTRWQEFTGVLPPRWSGDLTAHTGVVALEGRIYHLPADLRGHAVVRKRTPGLLAGLLELTVVGHPDVRVVFVASATGPIGRTRPENDDNDYHVGMPTFGLATLAAGRQLAVNGRSLPALADGKPGEIVVFHRAGDRISVTSLTGHAYTFGKRRQQTSQITPLKNNTKEWTNADTRFFMVGGRRIVAPRLPDGSRPARTYTLQRVPPHQHLTAVFTSPDEQVNVDKPHDDGTRVKVTGLPLVTAASAPAKRQRGQHDASAMPPSATRIASGISAATLTEGRDTDSDADGGVGAGVSGGVDGATWWAPRGRPVLTGPPPLAEFAMGEAGAVGGSDATVRSLAELSLREQQDPGSIPGPVARREFWPRTQAVIQLIVRRKQHCRQIIPAHLFNHALNAWYAGWRAAHPGYGDAAPKLVWWLQTWQDCLDNNERNLWAAGGAANTVARGLAYNLRVAGKQVRNAVVADHGSAGRDRPDMSTVGAGGRDGVVLSDVLHGLWDRQKGIVEEKKWQPELQEKWASDPVVALLEGFTHSETACDTVWSRLLDLQDSADFDWPGGTVAEFTAWLEAFQALQFIVAHPHAYTAEQLHHTLVGILALSPPTPPGQSQPDPIMTTSVVSAAGKPAKRARITPQPPEETGVRPGGPKRQQGATPKFVAETPGTRSARTSGRVSLADRFQRIDPAHAASTSSAATDDGQGAVGGMGLKQGRLGVRWERDEGSGLVTLVMQVRVVGQDDAAFDLGWLLANPAEVARLFGGPVEGAFLTAIGAVAKTWLPAAGLVGYAEPLAGPAPTDGAAQTADAVVAALTGQDTPHKRRNRTSPRSGDNTPVRQGKPTRLTATRLRFTAERADAVLGVATAALLAAGLEVWWPSSLVTRQARIRVRFAASAQHGGWTEPELDIEIQEAGPAGQWRSVGTLTMAEAAAVLGPAEPGALVLLRGQWSAVDPLMLAQVQSWVRQGRLPSVRELLAEAVAAVLGGGRGLDGATPTLSLTDPLPGLAAALTTLPGPVSLEAGVLPGFAGVLANYQRVGVTWLAQRIRLGLGAVLADDMGLGKTVQIIATHLYLHSAAGGLPMLGPTLVIVPPKLLDVWRGELARFAPDIHVVVYHEAGQRHPDHLAGLTDMALADSGPRGQARRGTVVLTTMHIACTDAAVLGAVPWGMAVADEAHHATHPGTRAATGLHAATARARARIAVTGTPVSNTSGELWALLHWTTPGLVRPGRRLNKLLKDLDTTPDHPQIPVAAAIAAAFVLRRRKTDRDLGMSLPAKHVTIWQVPLTPRQRERYTRILNDALREHGSDVLPADANTAHTPEQDAAGARIRVHRNLKLISQLRQIVNHPDQILDLPDQANRPATLRWDAVALAQGQSGKFDALDAILSEINTRRDASPDSPVVLVYSFYLRTLDLIQHWLTSHGVEVSRLDGRMSLAERTQAVTRLQHIPRNDPALPMHVMLVSLTSGGEGLTLTRAAHVVLFDRWWNPAREDQAIDRAHRYGQIHPVQVVILQTTSGLERHMAEILHSKTGLAQRLLATGTAAGDDLEDGGSDTIHPDDGGTTGSDNADRDIINNLAALSDQQLHQLLTI